MNFFSSGYFKLIAIFVSIVLVFIALNFGYKTMTTKELIDTKQLTTYITSYRAATLSKYYSDQAEKIWGNKAGVASIRLIEEIDIIIADTSLYLYPSISTEKVLGIMSVESGFNPLAISSAKCVGLMQVMPSTALSHDKTSTVEKLKKRRFNTKIGILEFSRLLYVFDGDMDLALLSYNRGEFRVKNLLLSNIDPDNGYAEKVYDHTISKYEYAALIISHF